MGEPLVYLDGDVVELADARISPFDRGFLWGDGIYEVTPVFDGRVYRLADHVERMYRSLAWVQIDPGMTPEAMVAASAAYVAANADAGRLAPGAMYRLGHWITRGVDSASMKAPDAGPATVVMWLRPADTARIARDQASGIDLVVPATRRVPPQALEARAKITSKLNQVLAELDAGARGAQPLMLDLDGHVAEHATANFFMVRDGVLWTPPPGNILEGITRKVVFEMADRIGVPVEERLFTMYDVAQATEWFISSSAICAMPVRAVERFTRTDVPGPVTTRLIDAFAADTGYDFRGRGS